jgi:hypothetical protein
LERGKRALKPATTVEDRPGLDDDELIAGLDRLAEAVGELALGGSDLVHIDHLLPGNL